MNEQIKQFADEAAKFSAIMALPTGESGDKLFVEKFAELIVRECAQFVEDNFDFVGDEIVVKEKMLEYFGVEQDPEEDSDETCPRCGEEWSGTSCGLPECGWVVGGEE